jgi:hypothetical protein
MSNIVEIADIRKKEIKKQEGRMVDIRASYTVLENATRYLGMNNLPELKPLKSEIQRTMLELRKILQNGR